MTTKPFYIAGMGAWLKKGDVVQTSRDHDLLVVKVYTPTRWRRFWTWVGFDMHINNVKVKILK